MSHNEMYNAKIPILKTGDISTKQLSLSGQGKCVHREKRKHSNS